MGDIVAGFFILSENLLLVGDLVEVSGVRGKVEEVGVRITKIRDDSGVLHSIPNGEVRKISSHSKDHVNATVDVFVPYEEDPRRVRALLTSLAEEVLEAETGKRAGVEVKVQEPSEGSVMFRANMRVPPGKDEDLGDALRARLLESLRDAGVGAPRARRAIMIDDGGLRIAAPAQADVEEEENSKPANPFQPPDADGAIAAERRGLGAGCAQFRRSRGRAVPEEPLETVPLVDLDASRRVSRRVDHHGSSQVLHANAAIAAERPDERPIEPGPRREDHRLARAVAVLRREQHGWAEQAGALEPQRLHPIFQRAFQP